MAKTSVTNLTANDVLVWTGTHWVNTTVLVGVQASSLIAGIEIVGEFTAYEAITAGDAVALIAPDAEDQTYGTANQDAELNLGDAAARTYVAQGFKPGASTFINKVDVYMKKTGTPLGNITVSIYSGTTTPVTNLGSATILTSDVGTTFAFETATFANPIEVTSGSQYFIVLTRTVAVDVVNYFIMGVDDSSASYGTTNDTRFVGDATPAWTATTTSDLIFKTYKEDTTVAAQVRPTKATSKLRTFNFIGFAESTVAAAATVTITRFPSKTSLTSITPGRAYYLSDTAGAIATTGGTYPLNVGIGKTTTSLEMTPNQRPLRISTLLDVLPTNVNVSNAASGEVVYSKIIEANTLSADGVMRVMVWGQTPVSTSEATASVAVVFGGTTFYTSSDLTQNPQVEFKVEVYIFNRDATGTQIAHGQTFIVDKDNPTTVTGTFYGTVGTTGSIDTTADQTLQVTATEAGSAGGANPVIYTVLVEQL